MSTVLRNGVSQRHRNVTKRLLFASMFLLMTTAEADSSRENPNTDWMPNEIDWQRAETVTLSLLDHSYEPDEVELAVNRPYKLVMDNISHVSTHDLNGIDFFHSVVFSRIEADTHTVLTPHIHSLLIKPRSKTVLYLVPKVAGEYAVYCSIPGHKEEGMEGFFVIADK